MSAMKRALYILSIILFAVSCTPAKEVEPEKPDEKEKNNGKEDTPQKEESRLILSETSVSVGADGGVIEVKVTSNVDVKAVIQDNTTWISMGETKADMTETVHTFTVEPNPETAPREADIRFINEEEKLSETLHVSQEGREEVKGPGIYGIAGLHYEYDKGRHQYLVRKEGSLKKFVILNPGTQQFLSVRMVYSNEPGAIVEASILQNVIPQSPSLQEHIRLKVEKVEGGCTFFSSIDDKSQQLVLNYADESSRDWSITGTMVTPQWDTNASIPMTLEGDLWVARGVSLSASDKFKFIYRHSWDVNRGGNIQELGTSFPLTQNGPDILPGVNGIVDIYMSADTNLAFVVLQ